MALRFTWSETKPVTIKNAKGADPQVIGLALHAIRTKNGGRLNWEVARADCSSRRNPLHRHFEWNDKIAAEKYRHDQFNELVRLVIRDDPDNPNMKPARAFISINDEGGTAYRSVDEVIGSADLQLRVLQSARRDLVAWQDRYSDLVEICGLIRIAEERLQTAIRETEGQTRRRSARVESATVSPG